MVPYFQSLEYERFWLWARMVECLTLKVDGSQMVTFTTSPLLVGYETHDIVQGG